MIPRTPSQILNEIAHQHTRKDIDLSSRIMSKVRKENVNIMKSKLVLSGILGFAFIFVILFSIPSVATAMKRLFGYIPNAGLVDTDSTLRILKEPVQTKQADTTITVTQGVVDSQSTTIIYQVENIPAAPIKTNPQDPGVCHKLPELVLPDGTRSQGQVDSGDYWTSGYEFGIKYPALPKDVNTVKLEFTCLERTVIVPEMQNFELTLNFVVAPADMKVYPLVDLPTPTPLPTQEVSVEPTQLDTDNSLNTSDFRLAVNKYVQTEDSVILLGSVESVSDTFKVLMVDSSSIHLLDASGKDIPLEEDYSLTDPEVTDPRSSFHWTYRTAGSYSPGQAVLKVDSIWVGMGGNSSFTFDPGPDPKPEQEWMLNKEVVVYGRTIKIESAQMNKDGNGLSFIVDAPDDIYEISFMDLDHMMLGGGGGQDNYGFSYQDGFPSGEINVTLNYVTIILAGPWETSVDLPAMTSSVIATDVPGACLTKSSWKSAVTKASPLPEGLDGKLAMFALLESDQNYHVMTANLDGTNQQILASGTGISLSPDGSQIIYNSDIGLQTMDLNSTVSTALMDRGTNDFGAIWSPDGKKIAYTRGPDSALIGAPGPYSVFMSNPDGTEQRPLVENGDANTAQAWLPDSQSIVYTVTGPYGAAVRSINVSSGQITHLFNVKYSNTTVAVSPDGKRIAYQEMLPGDRYSIFVSNLDGSNPKLIVDASPIVVTIPQWSPDGEWIVASVHDEAVSPYSSVLVLVKVDTCQIIPLTSLKGYVANWK